MKRFVFSWKYAAAIAAIVLLVFAVIDFNSRVANLQRLRQKRTEVSAELEHLLRTQAALETQRAFVTSEAGVQQWAYEQGHLQQPGDVRVVPIAPGDSTPAPTVVPVRNQQPVAYWQMWMWLFFGPPGQSTTDTPGSP